MNLFPNPDHKIVAINYFRATVKYHKRLIPNIRSLRANGSEISKQLPGMNCFMISDTLQIINQNSSLILFSTDYFNRFQFFRSKPADKIKEFLPEWFCKMNFIVRVGVGPAFPGGYICPQNTLIVYDPLVNMLRLQNMPDHFQATHGFRIWLPEINIGCKCGPDLQASPAHLFKIEYQNFGCIQNL